MASAASALAGCSADITRFDNASFAIGEGASVSAARRTAGGPVGGSAIDTPAALPSAPPSTYSATPPSRSRGAEVAGPPVLQEASVPPVRAMAVTRGPAPAIAPPASAALPKGQQIEVQQGDTLYAIGRRHNVMISDLMAVNELRNPNLKPGQTLFLPAGNGRTTPQVKPERTAAIKAGPAPVSAPVATAPGLGAGDSYTVKPGDSLYAIAARHKIKVGDLQRANAITDVSKVKPGMVLKLPSGEGPAAAQAVATGAGETVQPETRIVRVGATSATPPGVKVLNGDGQSRVAAAEPVTATDATPAAAVAQSGKLRWPVKGRVVQGFGARADGSHNDGVDISVPAGTDVLAAEGGVVAYAGNEVKTYGNLVLIRHDNGWVTAYAYNEKLLVQRGDRVKRGQAIAKAGKSGVADQPQVHFEVRVGSKPVDPTGYLEKL